MRRMRRKIKLHKVTFAVISRLNSISFLAEVETFSRFLSVKYINRYAYNNKVTLPSYAFESSMSTAHFQ